VKLVPLWRPGDPTFGITTFYDETDDTSLPSGRNSAPVLTEVEYPPRIDLPVEGFPPLRVTLNKMDPDGDVLEPPAAFTTSGLVTIDEHDEGSTVEVNWIPEPADADRSPQVFVVSNDGRGGTGVWASDRGADADTCAQPSEVEFTSPAFPGDVLVAEFADAAATVKVAGTLQGEGTSESLLVQIQLTDAATGELLAISSPGLRVPLDVDEQACTATFEADLGRATTLPLSGLCDYGGALVDVQATVTSGFTTLSTTTRQAILHLDPDLPCLQD
jgi:hypothetical protein